MKRHRFKAKSSVYFLLYVLMISLFLGWAGQHIYNNWIISAAETDLTKVRAAMAPVQDLQEENAALKEKLESSSKIATPESIKELSRFYIKKYFGKDADRVMQVMTCESNLNNQAIHVNREGLGKDLGLYQLNDRWHRARFEKMFNIPFEIGALDWDLSSRYAKFMFDNSKGLSPWVCSRIK